MLVRASNAMSCNVCVYVCYCALNVCDEIDCNASACVII